MEDQNYFENKNVQQSSGLAGQVDGNVMKTVRDIVDQAVNQPTEEECKRQERLLLLDRYRITTQTIVMPLEYSLAVDNVGIFALSDIHAIKGKQKSGKSAVLKCMLSALLGKPTFRLASKLTEPVILHLDTEQQDSDVKLIVDMVGEMSGASPAYIDSHLFLYTLRTMGYDTLMNDTRLLIARHRPQVVLVDGLVDYVCSFNNEEMSRQLIHDLIVVCQEYHCAIVNVLHENKAQEDMNMRGHLGTVLAQKAGTVLQCTKQDGIYTVSCSDARHTPMPVWSITFDDEGHLCQADELRELKRRKTQMLAMEKQKEAYEKTRQEREKQMLTIVRDNGGRIVRKELVDELAKVCNIAQSTAQRFLKSLIGTKLNEVNGFITVAQGEELAF